MPRVLELPESQKEQAEHQHIGYGAHQVIIAAPALIVARRIRRQITPPDKERRHAEWHIDKKQPVPGSHRQNSPGNRRACRRGTRDYHRVKSQTTPQNLARIYQACKRDIDTHHAGRTDTLDCTSHKNHREITRRRAKRRCKREHHHTRKESASVTEHIANRRQRQDKHSDQKLINSDNPHRQRIADAKLSGQHRERHIHNRHIQHRHDQHNQQRHDSRVFP